MTPGDTTGLSLTGLFFVFDFDLLLELLLGGAVVSKSLGETLVWMLLNLGFWLLEDEY